MKAILVIDMPSNCAVCQFCGFGGINLEKYVCSLTREHSEGPHIVGCPLIPLEKNYISIDWLKQSIPFQNEEDRYILLSMLEAWRRNYESNISN